MKKIIIDNFIFNKCIKDGKFEVAEFLLENECPNNFTAYLQVLDIKIFEWLDKHGIPLDNPNFSLYIIEKTQDKKILDWFFIQKKVPVSDSAVKYSISKGDKNILQILLNYGYKLTEEEYILASNSLNLDILEFLYENKCPYSNKVEKAVLKLGDKNVIKWFIQKNLF